MWATLQELESKGGIFMLITVLAGKGRNGVCFPEVLQNVWEPKSSLIKFSPVGIQHQDFLFQPDFLKKASGRAWRALRGLQTRQLIPVLGNSWQNGGHFAHSEKAHGTRGTPPRWPPHPPPWSRAFSWCGKGHSADVSRAAEASRDKERC